MTTNTHTIPRKTALVLGATGRFGRHMSMALKQAGWSVRPFDRATDDLPQAAKGADIIVYGWNPSYDQWQDQVAGQADQVIAVAKSTGAIVLVPGNVYVYGAETPAVMHPETPHLATNPLGRVRIDLESRFRNGGVQTILLRAGDFLDTAPSGNWFDQVIAKSVGKGKITYPGRPNIPHAWAFLPDYCRAFVALAGKRADLPTYTSVNYGGYTLSGNDIARILDVRLTRMNWLPIWALQPVWKMARHLMEMRYLWNTPHQLDNTMFEELLPDFKPTPAAEALAQAVSFQINPNQSVVTAQPAV